MKKVITYGTYDMLHYGHIRLLERAKQLGDYLIVGVTSDDFDKKRGKINTRQSLFERINAIIETGLADKVIVEEYEGQKIDDIKKYNIDVFAIGSDWVGKFDYLSQFCEVVYLERTEGISSSQIRKNENKIKLGYWGRNYVTLKYMNQTDYVNGLEKSSLFDKDEYDNDCDIKDIKLAENKEDFFNDIDACFVYGKIKDQCKHSKSLLEANKHLLCSDLPCLHVKEYDELCELADKKDLTFMTGVKTAYSVAYHRLILLIKTGIIGDVVDIRATCTSLTNNKFDKDDWSAMCDWGPTAMLPIFQILGVDYKTKVISFDKCKNSKIEKYARVDFFYENATATIFVSKKAKSEGILVISGTKGCIYVPAPWWKTDYFEVHYENIEDNKKFFFQLDGEGIRNVLLQFYTNIINKRNDSYVDKEVTRKTIEVIEEYIELLNKE